jgi:hypothetical protein
VLGALSVDSSLDGRRGCVGAGAGWHTDCGCVQLEWGDDFFDQHLLFSSGTGLGWALLVMDQGKHLQKQRSNTLHAWCIELPF